MEKPNIEKLIEFEAQAISSGNLTESEASELMHINRKIKDIHGRGELSPDQSEKLGSLLKKSGDLVFKSQVDSSESKKNSLINKAYGVLFLVVLAFCLTLYLMSVLAST